jgi:hypothetical protein
LLKSVSRLSEFGSIRSVWVSATYRFRMLVSPLVLTRCVCIHTNKRQRLYDKRYVTATEPFFNKTIKKGIWETAPPLAEALKNNRECPN